MAKPLSEDLRRRVVVAIEAGATIPEAAEQCEVSISSATVGSLCEAIASCLPQISRSECAAYLANSGYGQSNRETL
jgi:hypothetical protein